jgi:hypothetical protein
MSLLGQENSQPAGKSVRKSLSEQTDRLPAYNYLSYIKEENFSF